MIRLRPGRCLVCGCTDAWGCAAGCWWVDDPGPTAGAGWHMLCSRCARNMAVLILALRRQQEGPR